MRYTTNGKVVLRDGKNWVTEASEAKAAALAERMNEKTTVSLDDLKAEKLKALIAKRDENYKNLVTDSYPMDEKDTFSFRTTEAVAYQSDNTVATPFIDASLPSGFTAEQRAAEITAVYQKALGVAALGGQSRDLRNSIESTTTVAELEAIKI